MGTEQLGAGNNAGYGSDYLGLPFLFTNGMLGKDAPKEAHDSYNVYVNRDYIGSKALVSQVENIEDVSKYLHNQGFDNFTTNLEGNQYVVNADGRDAHDIKQTLNVYLNNK